MMTEYRSLILAIREKDTDEIRSIVEDDPDMIKERDERGVTPLLASVEADLPEITAFLLSEGADIQDFDSHGFSVLHLVKSRGPAEELISHGATINLANNYGKTPLHIAVIDGHRDLVELFLDHGADKEARDHKNFTPLMMAVDYQLPDIEALLRAHGAVE
jgi:uncharacterized protein